MTLEDFTLAATADGDIHCFEGDLRTTVMKADRKKWLMTVDGRYVRADKVVSLWTPQEGEVDNAFLQG